MKTKLKDKYYCNKCNKLILFGNLNGNEREELLNEGSFVCSDCINIEMEVSEMKPCIDGKEHNHTSSNPYCMNCGKSPKQLETNDYPRRSRIKDEQDRDNFQKHVWG